MSCSKEYTEQMKEKCPNPNTYKSQQRIFYPSCYIQSILLNAYNSGGGEI